MLRRFGAWLTSLGISRDDVLLVWTQWISVATMILSGALNLTTIGEPLGIHISPPVMHWIMVGCTASLWFGAKMATSPPLQQGPHRRHRGAADGGQGGHGGSQAMKTIPVRKPTRASGRVEGLSAQDALIYILRLVAAWVEP